MIALQFIWSFTIIPIFKSGSANTINNSNKNKFCAVISKPLLSLYCNRVDSIAAIDKSIFADKSSLNHIEIRNQQNLLNLKDGLFESISEINTLKLINTGITSLTKKFINHPIEIKHLVISDNKNLSNIESSALKSITKVETLDLSNNNLKSLPKDLFGSDMNTVKTIVLAGNPNLKFDSSLVDKLNKNVKLIFCTRPKKLRNLYILPSDTEYFQVGERITYFCDKNFYTEEEVRSYCKSNTHWTSDTPKCVTGVSYVAFFAGFLIAVVMSAFVFLIKKWVDHSQRPQIIEETFSVYSNETEPHKPHEADDHHKHHKHIVRKSVLNRESSEESLLGVLTKIGHERHSHSSKHSQSHEELPAAPPSNKEKSGLGGLVDKLFSKNKNPQQHTEQKSKSESLLGFFQNMTLGKSEKSKKPKELSIVNETDIEDNVVPVFIKTATETSQTSKKSNDGTSTLKRLFIPTDVYSPIPTNTSQIQADTSQIAADANQIQADTSQIQADTSQVQADTSQMKEIRKPSSIDSETSSVSNSTMQNSSQQTK